MAKDDIRDSMLRLLLVGLNRVYILLIFNACLHILYNLALDELWLPGC